MANTDYNRQLTWEILIELSKHKRTVAELAKILKRHIITVARALKEIPLGVKYIDRWEIYTYRGVEYVREVWAVDLNIISMHAPQPANTQVAITEVTEITSPTRRRYKAQKNYTEIVLKYKAQAEGARQFAAKTGIAQNTVYRALAWARTWEELHKVPVHENSWMS